ncbi:MAG: ATP-dependent RNA helicase DbpA [Polyangiales bacterium]
MRALALSDELLQVLAELGFTVPTEIQAQAIPLLLSGRDLIGQSQTGSGKTAAFGLPILQQLRVDRQRILQALVLCPTRELCAQVARELRRLGRRHAGLQVLTVAGGEPLRAQAAALDRGVHVVVGTPGRVRDQLQRGSLQLQSLASLVLDEADRMLDMGFQEDMEEILRHTPPERQTVFFSATFPRSIAQLSAQYQRDPARVTIEAAPAERPAIEQRYCQVDHGAKGVALQQLLAAHPHEAALVFANQKATTSELAQALTAAGVSADCLHGDMEQYERDLVLAKFRNASTRVLVATDVAARGIDVASLDLVVNYDLPTRFDTYLHRIGRTGRAGKTGLAISLATRQEAPRIAALEEAHGVVITLLALTPAAPSAPEPPQNAAMETLRIAGGRKQKVRPADILGALTGEAGGLKGTDIGKIEIHDHFSYVAVARHVSDQAHRGLQEGRIKGRRFPVARVK